MAAVVGLTSASMAGKPGFLRFVSAAFNARPFGMFVPPNWIALAATGLLGLAEPGIWVIGAGFELAYLLVLASNERFQRAVAPAPAARSADDWTARTGRALLQLSETDRRRYQQVAERCRSIIELQVKDSVGGAIAMEAQHESLARLAWLYLRLLVGRHTIRKVQADANPADELPGALAALESRLGSGETLTAELRRSLEGQAEILRQRIEHRKEAARQVAFIESELVRIEQQVELIREQAALSTDPATLSGRIDEITATLGGTSQWIRDQQQMFGAMDDLLSEPPLPRAEPQKERQ
jgi:hypothetical protein